MSSFYNYISFIMIIIQT